MTILINPMAPAPTPVLHESMPEPTKIAVAQFKGLPWEWDPEKVSLIRTKDSKTLTDELVQIAYAHDKQLLRPLTCAEMLQISEFSSDLPEKWKREAGGRLFFGGSVYELTYVDDAAPETPESLQIVPYAWFDGGWDYEWLPTTIPLRKDDVFPCVPFGVNERILDCTPMNLPPLRRTRTTRCVSLLREDQLRVRGGLVPMPQ